MYLELEVRRIECRHCGAVKREQLEFLADNAHYTKRFAYYVGRRRRQSTIREVAEELHSTRFTRARRRDFSKYAGWRILNRIDSVT